jgi:type VI secretion system VasD/TssJ family lipoprotein
MNRARRVDKVFRFIRAHGCAYMSMIVVWLLCGCGGSYVAIQLQGDKLKLNTCGKSDPQPVVVRLYQLKGEAKFRKVTPDVFWKDDVAALSGEVIGTPTEVMLRPGEPQEKELALDKQTTHVGIAADFCKPDGDSWRKVFQVRDFKGGISLVLYEGRIVLQAK